MRARIGWGLGVFVLRFKNKTLDGRFFERVQNKIKEIFGNFSVFLGEFSPRRTEDTETEEGVESGIGAHAEGQVGADRRDAPSFRRDRAVSRSVGVPPTSFNPFWRALLRQRLDGKAASPQKSVVSAKQPYLWFDSRGSALIRGQVIKEELKRNYTMRNKITE